MALTLIVGAERVTVPWMEALSSAGHGVEHCTDVLSFQERFGGTPADVLLIDIANADHGEAMLMVQARTVWPDCRVIALPRDRSYRSSAIFRMGLWAPDRLLMQPVDAEVLVRTVEQLRMQARVDRIVRDRREAHARRVGADPRVVLRCDVQNPPTWSVKVN